MCAFVCVRAHVHTPLALQCEWIAKDNQLLKKSLRHEKEQTITPSVLPVIKIPCVSQSNKDF